MIRARPENRASHFHGRATAARLDAAAKFPYVSPMTLAATRAYYFSYPTPQAEDGDRAT